MRQFLFVTLLLLIAGFQSGFSQYSEPKPVRSLLVDQPPLHTAAANGDVRILLQLIEQGTPVDSRALGTGATALHFAAAAGKFEAADTLIKAGADPEAKTNFDASALHYASGFQVLPRAFGRKFLSTPPCGTNPGLTKGHKNIVRLLVAMGVDVNARTASGSTPLNAVAIYNDVEIAETLLENGANADTREHQYSALDIAIGRGPDVARLLIKYGANVNARVPFSQETPLHNAVNCERIEITRMLLQKGADVNAKWPGAGNNATPLDLAISKGSKELADLLLAHGARR